MNQIHFRLMGKLAQLGEELTSEGAERVLSKMLPDCTAPVKFINAVELTTTNFQHALPFDLMVDFTVNDNSQCRYFISVSGAGKFLVRKG